MLHFRSLNNPKGIEFLITEITRANTIDDLNAVQQRLIKLKTGANTLKNVADILMKIHFNAIKTESQQRLITTKNSLKDIIEQLNQQCTQWIRPIFQV